MQNNKTLLQESCTHKHYEVSLADLPLSCPMPNSYLWDAHPKVYLPIEEEGIVQCPYCSTQYILIDNRVLSKPAPAVAREFGGGSERRTAAYKDIREDSSTEPTNKLPAKVGFGKNSNGQPM